MRWFRKRRTLVREIKALRDTNVKERAARDRAINATEDIAGIYEERLRVLQEEDTEIINELSARLTILLDRYRELESENLRAAGVLNTQVEVLVYVGTTELANVVTVQALVNEMKDTGTVYTIQKVLRAEDR